MKIIAITNQKGGVAKSTTAVNLSASLAIEGHKTLLIDLDQQANSSQGVDITPNNFNHGTADLFENPKMSLTSAVNSTAIQYLSVIPSDLSLGQVEWDLLMNYKPEHTRILKNKIKAIESDFDYVIIDCPPNVGLFTMNALMVADRVLIPVSLDFYAIVGIKYLYTNIDQIRMAGNKTLKVLGIVRTLWDKRPILGREISHNLELDYPGKLFETIITQSIKIKESAVNKIPVVMYDHKSQASMQYKSLLNEVLSRW